VRIDDFVKGRSSVDFNNQHVKIILDNWLVNQKKSSITVYGQTGSGKSFTMQKEVLPFTMGKLMDHTNEFEFQLKMLEVYNNKLKDLVNIQTVFNKLRILNS
jgi:Cdc6-like AAA superfamily ATPase